MSGAGKNSGWWDPIKVGLLLSTLVLAGFAAMALQRNCVYLPTEVLECRHNWEWFWSSPPNEIGDTLAGFAGTLAFIWIVATVWLQSNELAEQRKQLEKQTIEFEGTNKALAAQRFDQSFFGLLSTLNQIVSEMDVHDDILNREAKGRDCFAVFFNDFRKSYAIVASKGPEDGAKQAFEVIWKKYHANLGHYLRFLYNFLRFLSESEHTTAMHRRVLRAQLSDQELLVIFYNCISGRGEKLNKYAEEFELFDNMPRVNVLHGDHFGLIPERALGQPLLPERRAT